MQLTMRATACGLERVAHMWMAMPADGILVAVGLIWSVLGSAGSWTARAVMGWLEGRLVGWWGRP